MREEQAVPQGLAVPTAHCATPLLCSTQESAWPRNCQGWVPGLVLAHFSGCLDALVYRKWDRT